MYSEQRRYCPRRPTLGWIMTSEPGRGAAGPRRVTSLRRAGWRRAAGPGRPPRGVPPADPPGGRASQQRTCTLRLGPQAGGCRPPDGVPSTEGTVAHCSGNSHLGAGRGGRAPMGVIAEDAGLKGGGPASERAKAPRFNSAVARGSGLLL